MRVNQYGEHIYTIDDILDYYMRNPDAQLRRVSVEGTVTTYSTVELSNRPQLVPHRESSETIEEYDSHNQNMWLMPTEYRELDIAAWVLDKCTTEAELQRVGQELLLYQQYEMFDLLRYMVYLVDVMRKNNIIWGVGRGSSVASYVLYLIGIHRINSLTYDLDIREFLK